MHPQTSDLNKGQIVTKRKETPDIMNLLGGDRKEGIKKADPVGKRPALVNDLSNISRSIHSSKGGRQRW